MTLRDYFAGQAVVGILSKYSLRVPDDQDIVCAMSYEIADQMLKQRLKPNETT